MYRTAVLAAALALGLAAALAGCAGPGSKPSGGGLLGSVVGAPFGRGTGKLVGPKSGAMAAAYAGSDLGKALDRADRLAMDRTAGHAFEYNRGGQTAEWRNPDSGHAGTVTPTRTYEATGRQTCREYRETVTAAGRTAEARGTACREPDGSWKIVSGV